MLVNRSIDKSKEKLALLEAYIKDNNYNEGFYSPLLDKNGNFVQKEIHVSASELCKILLINPKTLRNWQKRKSVYLSKIRHQGKPYISLRSLLFFLRNSNK